MFQNPCTRAFRKLKSPGSPHGQSFWAGRTGKLYGVGTVTFRGYTGKRELKRG